MYLFTDFGCGKVLGEIFCCLFKIVVCLKLLILSSDILEMYMNKAS